jgi:hypothetical protein
MEASGQVQPILGKSVASTVSPETVPDAHCMGDWVDPKPGPNAVTMKRFASPAVTIDYAD